VFSPIFIHLPANHFLPQAGKPWDARAMTAVAEFRLEMASAFRRNAAV
jgi:hypothetical protein